MDDFWLDVWLYDTVADPGAISGSVDVVCGSCGEPQTISYDEYNSDDAVCCRCGEPLDS